MLIQCKLKKIVSERPVSDAVGDHHENESAHDKSQIDLPAELDLGTVVYAAHGKLHEGTSRPEAVGDAVAVLICEH